MVTVSSDSIYISFYSVLLHAGAPISIAIGVGRNSVTSACGSNVSYNPIEVNNDEQPVVDLTSVDLTPGELDSCVSAWELKEV